jgi:hypothetical protein
MSVGAPAGGDDLPQARQDKPAAQARPPRAAAQFAAPSPKSAPDKTAQPKQASEPGYIVANVERDDVLNVRSGPSAEHDIVGELQPGSRGVAITGECRSRWCPVQHESTTGWVHANYLVKDDPLGADPARPGRGILRDPPEAPRTCLAPAARALLERIEEKFGPVELVSTCRPGATIAGTGRPSKHASGNAVDFNAGRRKAEIVEWLIANHHDGGTMTYRDMDHIHIDIGPHFVSIAGGMHWASWNRSGREFPGQRGTSDRDSVN